MAWTFPAYSRSRVDKAGRSFVDPSASAAEKIESAEILNNWRAAHAFPLNTFQIYLRAKSKSVCELPIISQRLKRMESIERKLLSGTNNISQMQDIGGCRAVVQSISEVRDLVESYKKGRSSQIFKNEKDYISSPKSDGYRSYHLIYRYKGRGSTSVYDGLQIETQIRTQLQHAWATAVEAVRARLKTGWRDASNMIHAGYVDPSQPRPHGRDREEDATLSDRSDRRRVVADRALAASTG